MTPQAAFDAGVHDGRLRTLIDLIDAGLSAPDRPNEESWRAADRKARAVLDTLARKHDASWGGSTDYYLKLAGIRTTCTAGTLGLLRNWQTAARRKMGLGAS